MKILVTGASGLLGRSLMAELAPLAGSADALIGTAHSRLKAPVYARRFTAAIAQNKMERAGQDPSLVRQAAVWPQRVQAVR